MQTKVDEFVLSIIIWQKPPNLQLMLHCHRWVGLCGVAWPQRMLLRRSAFLQSVVARVKDTSQFQ